VATVYCENANYFTDIKRQQVKNTTNGRFSLKSKFNFSGNCQTPGGAKEKLNVYCNTFPTWTATTSRIIAARENGKAGSFPAWLLGGAGAFHMALEDQVNNLFFSFNI